MRVEAHQEPAAGGGADRVESVAAAWASENPRSAALHARARQLLPGGVTHDVRRAAPFPLAVERAQGARKQDLDGHELICYVMGHGSLLLGHGHPAVVAAVREQATRSFHPGACHELESEWAEAVLMMRPHFCAFIPGTAARIAWNAAVRLMAMIKSHFSGGKSSTGETCWMPALLTRMSTDPILCWASAIIAAISGPLAMSAPL